MFVEIAMAARASGAKVAAAMMGGVDAHVAVHDLASDLGIVAVDEVAPLVSVMAVIEAGAKRPWRASIRTLSDVDRARLGNVCIGERGGGRLTRHDGGLLAFHTDDDEVFRVGEPRDVAIAIGAMHAADRITSASASVVDAVDRREVLDVIFGPPRALSDPASKQALAPYGIPLPEEELCTSPSRAAAEAARIGFPVRIAVASPDVRVWDHPDLAVDGVESAARVREVYRQVTTMAQTRVPKARLLGVTVTATRLSQAFLRLVATPLPHGLVLAEVGFADPHGVAAGDHTHTVLPAPGATIERVIGRLAGSPLVLHGTAAERRSVISGLRDLMLRVAAFVDDQRAEVECVEIDPVALLVGGAFEVREVCVTVGDAFQRSLEAPTG
jgi:hypothetical protein